jgi:hypothetical protein
VVQRIMNEVKKMETSVVKREEYCILVGDIPRMEGGLAGKTPAPSNMQIKE